MAEPAAAARSAANATDPADARRSGSRGKRELAEAFDPAPQRQVLRGPFRAALTIDVEEWYHTCLVDEYVDPDRRPPLVHELDRLLPDLLTLLAAARCQATFFVLGEVARKLPGRIRELAAAGHEIASHGHLHRRVGDISRASFRVDLATSRDVLEDTIGAQVWGYRAPEWSLRSVENPWLLDVAEAGYSYDSSLVPAAGSGRRSNPVLATRLCWANGRELVEAPPLTWGGGLRAPACGWTARILTPWIVERAAAHLELAGGLPVMTVHPWEVGGTATPGELTGLARFLHEAGRNGFRERFVRLLEARPWCSLSSALGGLALGRETAELTIPSPALAGVV